MAGVIKSSSKGGKYMDYPDGTKECTVCHIIKPVSEFYVRKASGKRKTDRLVNKCKSCEKVRKTELGDYYYQRTKHITLSEENKPKRREWRRKYKESHPIQVRLDLHNRRASLRSSSFLKWDKFGAIRDIIEAVLGLNKSYSGCKFSLDHVVPIRSDYVCGLHVPMNLDILSSQENSAKGNRFWPQMSEITPELKAMAKSFKEKEKPLNV